MSLPAGQERVLHDIEGALKAGEPQLASMYAIFARLNQDEPVDAEPLQRGRLYWLRPGSALSAIVLIPVMFAAVIIGAVLSGSARGATNCELNFAAGGESSVLHRPTCLRTHAPASSPPATAKSATAKPAAGARALSGPPGTSCPHLRPAVRFITVNGAEQGLPLPVRAGTAAAGPSGMC